MAVAEDISETDFQPTTFTDQLRRWAMCRPDQTVFTFLEDGETDAVYITFAELDAQARRIASCLINLGADGKRAILLYPPGLAYIAGFLGCLYAGVTAVPAYPPDPVRLNRTLPRLEAIVADAQAAFALTTSPILSMAEMVFAQAPALEKLTWVATDDLPVDEESDWLPPPIRGSDIAFLQYTSGSTGEPKGVILTHDNLLHNSRLIAHTLAISPTSVGMVWLPPYHDMGLIGGILQPLYSGIPCVLMSPLAFLQRPFRWLQAVSQYKATISGGPNFAYDLCVRKITPEQRAQLDLSQWRVAFNGAEPIRPESMERFAAAFAPCGFQRKAFHPCYGLAEGTLIVSGDLENRSPFLYAVKKDTWLQNQIVSAETDEKTHDSQLLVGCGQTLGDQEIAIVDTQRLVRLADEQIGEIWLAGASVASGYWNRPKETAETFQAYLADTGEGPFLRTGDLGFLHDGELFVTGRCKDLIIIRGRNHYPQDIELTVEKSHAALRPGCSAAFSIDVDGEERLVVAQEIYPNRLADLSEVTEAIRGAVAETHEVQVYAVALLKSHTIPKTSSGKIQRYACREQYLAGSLNVVNIDVLQNTTSWELENKHSVEPLLVKAIRAMPPDGRQELLESYLVELVSQSVGIPPAQVEPNRPLPSFGLDSAQVIEMTHAIETAVGIQLHLGKLLQDITLSQLASQLVTELTVLPVPETAVPIPLSASETAESQTHPLSYGQRALWFLHQLHPTSPAYNVVHAVRVCAPVHAPAMQSTIEKVVDRHRPLRTVFKTSNGEPVQQVLDKMDGVFQVIDATSWSEVELDNRLAQELYRPFDLENGPLMRLMLFQRAANDSILLLAMHHIITDLWSVALLIHEINLLYPAELDGTAAPLKPLPIQYTDYVREQRKRLAGPNGEQLRDFWLAQLEGELPVLNLPTDRPRTAVPSYHGACESIRLEADLSGRLKQLAKEQNATPFMLLLSAFHLLLHRYTGQENILIGTPMANRRRQVARLIGYFVNPIVIRANLAGDLDFLTFLAQVRQTTLAAFEHSEYPFPLLVEQLQPTRDNSRSPMFQVMFAWQKTTRLINSREMAAFALNESGGNMSLGGMPIESLVLDEWVSPFDLTLLIAEVGDELMATFEYSTDLFDRSTIRRMLAHFQVLLQGIACNPQQRLADYSLLTDEEVQQILARLRVPERPSPTPFVHQAIEAMAARQPQATAVSLGDARLTYAQLNRRANQLAHRLQKEGVGPDTIVAVLLERSSDAIVALLGILKAGGTYLPLDPTAPPARLAFMLEDAQPVLLLAQPHLVSSAISQVTILDACCPTLAQESDENLQVALKPENIAYIIYTSGSTGQPKGVLVSHGALADHCHNICRHYDLSIADRVLQFASFSFDQSLEQILPTLMCGAHLVLRGPDIWPPAQFPHFVAQKELTIINLPPAYWDQVVTEWSKMAEPVTVEKLRLVIIGGDVVRPETVARWHSLPVQQARLLNAYGPTETTITATTFEIPAAETAVPHHIPIGRPLPDRTAVILDPYGNPVPTGIPGELYLGGRCLASGYLNRPELTRERFVQFPVIRHPLLEHGEPITDHRLPTTVYRTGDLCRRLPDGNIAFLGRVDHQVKVRGFRVELGEIEAVLSQHPDVRQTAVVAHDEETGGDKRLVAYLALPMADAHTTAELRRFLQQRLPEYMVPATFVTLPELPLAASGKIDRRALPAPDLSRSQLSSVYAPPRSPVEESLTQLWTELLEIQTEDGRPALGIYDNFFELGGHSLLATRLASRLRDTFQVDIPLRSLFETPTIADLSLLIAQQQAAAADEENLVQLLTELETLSDDEVKHLLTQESP